MLKCKLPSSCIIKIRTSLFYFITAFLLAILALPITLNASSDNLPQYNRQLYPLTPDCSILEDKNSTLDYEDVTSGLFNSQFIKNDRNIVNLGYTKSSFWIKFTLPSVHTLPSANSWHLQFAASNTNSVSVFIPNKDGKPKIINAGYSYHFTEWNTEHRSLLFPVELQSTPVKIYTKIRSKDAIYLNVSLISDKKLLISTEKEYMLFGIFYGAMLAMILYNLFLFITVKDKNYLLYILYIASTTMFQLEMNGFAIQYLWPENRLLAENCRPILMSAMLVSAALFLKSFLDTRNWKPALDHFLKMYIILIASAGISIFVLPFHIAMTFVMILGLLGALLFLILGYVRLFTGYRIARFYCLGWTILLFGGMIYSFSDLGILPVSIITLYAYQVGTLLEVILLSFALADRFAVLRKEKEKAQRIALQSMAETNQVKDEFMANTSHELRTPLHGIIGIAESLIDNIKTEDTTFLHDNLRLIARICRRLSTMVNDIQDYHRMRNKDICLNFSSVNCFTAVDSVINLLRPLIRDTPVQIINSIAKESPLLYADENRFHQIIYNLIGNAIKFTESGTIIISSKQKIFHDTKNIITNISVQDSGRGIPQKDHERIFRYFEQIDGSVTRSRNGTGLGLTIAKQLVELHGGTIGVVSKPGQGSRFTFSMPNFVNSSKHNLESNRFEERPPATTEENPEHLTEKITGNPSLLIIEDDPVNIQVLENFLNSQTCSYSVCRNGKSGLEAIKAGSFDLVLLDIMMPELSGYEVCREIRLSFTHLELPVVLLTAKINNDNINEGYAVGANDYITKPFNINELIRRINLILEHRRNNNGKANCIKLQDKHGSYYFIADDVLYLTSDGKKTVFHTVNQDITVSILLKDVKKSLPACFIRIHKRHIVNVLHITKLSHIGSSRYHVYLNDTDDTVLTAGSVYAKSLKTLLKK
jgi:signal transduction histidine kinase/DNA-binding LytR/AlgR family response regulator